MWHRQGRAAQLTGFSVGRFSGSFSVNSQQIGISHPTNSLKLAEVLPNNCPGSSILISAGDLPAHQIRLATSLCPVPHSHLPLTWKDICIFNFNCHSTLKTQCKCHLLCEALPDGYRYCACSACCSFLCHTHCKVEHWGESQELW